MRHWLVEQLAPEAAQRARRVENDIAADVLAQILSVFDRDQRARVDLAQRPRHQHTVGLG